MQLWTRAGEQWPAELPGQLEQLVLAMPGTLELVADATEPNLLVETVLNVPVVQYLPRKLQQHAATILEDAAVQGAVAAAKRQPAAQIAKPDPQIVVPAPPPAIAETPERAMLAVCRHLFNQVCNHSVLTCLVYILFAEAVVSQADLSLSDSLSVGLHYACCDEIKGILQDLKIYPHAHSLISLCWCVRPIGIATGS